MDIKRHKYLERIYLELHKESMEHIALLYERWEKALKQSEALDNQEAKEERVKYSPSLSELIKESIDRGTVKDVKRTIRPPERFINSLMEPIASAMNNEPFTINFGGSESYGYRGKESVSVCESHHYDHSDSLNESHSFAETDQETPAQEPVPTQMPPFVRTFGQAINAMRLGLKVARKGWEEKGSWLELQVPDEHSKMTLPYLFINYPDNVNDIGSGIKYHTPGARCPWVAIHTDILTDDWMVVF